MTKEVRQWLGSDGLVSYIKKTQILSAVSKIIRGDLQCSLLSPRSAPHTGNQKKITDFPDCLLKLLELLDLQHLLFRPG